MEAETREQPFPLLAWDKPPSPQHVGLALGGGAARGLAHIGVLEVLEDEHIPIHLIAGCSTGALVGALYAAGVSAYRMHALASEMRWHTISTLSLHLSNLAAWGPAFKGLPLGLLDLDRLITWLEPLLDGAREISQLHIPFAAIATDIVTGEMVVMNDGDVAEAVRASCSVPGIFTPYRRQDRLLVDGGVIANLPVQVVRQMGAEYVIAVDVLPMPGEQRKEPENIVELTLTSLYALIRANQGYSVHANCTIAPDVDMYSLIDLTVAEELIGAGRAAAEIMLPQIRQDLHL